jgi:hypothetical protein
MLGEKGFLVAALIRARDEAYLNMLLFRRRLDVVVPASKYLSGSLPPEIPVGFSRRTGRHGHHVTGLHISSSLVYDMQYKNFNYEIWKASL